MVSAKMKALGVKKSVIREIFEYAKVRKAEIGAENVFDYSIGNRYNTGITHHTVGFVAPQMPYRQAALLVEDVEH